jgi:hypothetical protein
MPPSCCNMPLPSTTIQKVLNMSEQQALLGSILLQTRPWDERIMCPNTNCHSLISLTGKLDPKRPSEVKCKKCKTRVCKTCKGYVHPYGPECPSDWELEVVLHLASNQAWRRCYSCRTLVELEYGQTYMNCRCSARFCYLCGGVCDTRLGCPNLCNGEIELVKKFKEEEEFQRRELAKAAERAVQLAATASKAINPVRTETCNQELRVLLQHHKAEHQRYLDFETKQRWIMWSRHGKQRASLAEKQQEAHTKLRIKHQNLEQALEERQLSQEMELRTALREERQNCARKLKHMEGYCNGLNMNGMVPGRVVSERDLRELGQQYNIRDQLQRLHESKINVMREKQSRNTEAMTGRHTAEWNGLEARSQIEMAALEEELYDVERSFSNCFDGRKERLVRRWEVEEELLRAQLKSMTGTDFAPLPAIEWQTLSRRRSMKW